MHRTRAESVRGSLTSEEAVRLHTDGFSRAPQQHDFAALEAIYSDRYILVRPDGSVFNKEQVLEDLLEQKVAFHPIELNGVAVRRLPAALRKDNQEANPRVPVRQRLKHITIPSMSVKRELGMLDLFGR